MAIGSLRAIDALAPPPMIFQLDAKRTSETAPHLARKLSPSADCRRNPKRERVEKVILAPLLPNCKGKSTFSCITDMSSSRSNSPATSGPIGTFTSPRRRTATYGSTPWPLEELSTVVGPADCSSSPSCSTVRQFSLPEGSAMSGAYLQSASSLDHGFSLLPSAMCGTRTRATCLAILQAAVDRRCVMLTNLTFSTGFHFMTHERHGSCDGSSLSRKASQEASRSPREVRRVMILERPGLDKPHHPGSSKKRISSTKHPLTLLEEVEEESEHLSIIGSLTCGLFDLPAYLHIMELQFRPEKPDTTAATISRRRSKSPASSFFEKLYSFRNRRRSSANEHREVPFCEIRKVDLQKEFQKCKDNQNTRFDMSSSDITSIPSSIRDLVQLTELFLYKNKLTTLPSEIGNLVNLRKLGLSENYLTALPDTLAALVGLQALDLRHNRLNEIPPVIYQISSLETLWLRYNRITTVGEKIGQLKRLKMLDLRENKIQALPSSIGALSCLLVLLCSYNHLRSAPSAIGDCSELSQLDFQHNELLGIPDSIGKLHNLTRLGLRYNKLTSIPTSLANCTKLEEFNIEGNNMSQLPDGLLSRLSNLATINLSRNDFSSFPQGGPAQFTCVVTVNMEHNQINKVPFGIFSRAQQLATLNLKENELTSLPLDVGTWRNVVELNLSTNQLRMLPDDIDKLQNLEMLIVSNNYLKRLPPSVGNLKKLKELDLEENELEVLPSEIGFLFNLNKLLVQSNKLTCLPRTIGNLVSLKELRVGENNLTSLPEEVGTLENLKSLYINDNPSLHTLPYELALCQALEIMSIENCPLSQIPPEITAGGPSLVIQFLKMQGPYRGTVYCACAVASFVWPLVRPFRDNYGNCSLAWRLRAGSAQVGRIEDVVAEVSSQRASLKMGKLFPPN
ncbi:LOW QUALITY PROTEIN: hypothetical protein M514_04758 [Trichuris suis]|uniref:Disease resistance R13L4/SHOC-2-like LRR domain-containing protein n=1 Tax=Trichuris suis TaxID=68888 RepID=A0A085MWU2_9BILA|nr:LOW QUALITY PROTEIN: hypothetical protein M514_04758 [Trichuris suis]